MRFPRAHRLTLGAVITGSLFAAWMHVLCGPPVLSINDLHLSWIISRTDFFVHPPDAEPGLMSTHPELMKLDNPAVAFQARKAPGTLRIFCLGGSTTRGWPYHRTMSYPKILSFMLGDVLPGIKTEVINAGFMASDSFSDLRLIRQLRSFDPDILLIHEGINDEWNLPLHIGRRGWLLRAHLWLLCHVRLWGALRAWARPQDTTWDSAQAIRDWAAGARDSRPVIEHLRSNLDAVLRETNGRCQVVLLAPILTLKPSAAEETMALVNAALRDLASQRRILLIDMDKSFRAEYGPSEDHIIPPPITHPDWLGYVFMARSAARGLSTLKLLAPRSDWRWERLGSDTEYAERAGLTPQIIADAYQRLQKIYISVGKDQDAQTYLERAHCYAAAKHLGKTCSTPRGRK